MLKLKKSQYLNSYIYYKLYEIRKNVMIQNCLLHKDIQV